MKPDIEVKLHKWSKLTPAKRKKALFWLSLLIDDMENVPKTFDDNFTESYP